MADKNGNGGTRALVTNGIVSALGAAVAFVTLWSFLMKGTDESLKMLQESVRIIPRELKLEVKEFTGRFESRLEKLDDGRLSNVDAIARLQFSNIENETQHRCSSVVRNLEHQWTYIVEDLLQQCPTCRARERTYWPPGPGPNGAPH